MTKKQIITLTFLMAISIIHPVCARLEGCTEANEAVLFQGVNGTYYCTSKIPMNWFSAFSWCKGVGGELVSMDKACPGTGTGTCLNLKERQNIVTGAGWLSNPYIASNAYRITFSSGTVDPNAGRSNGNGQHPLCW